MENSNELLEQKLEEQAAFNTFMVHVSEQVEKYFKRTDTDFNLVEGRHEIKVKEQKYQHGSLKETITKIYKLNIHEKGKKKPLETIFDVRFNAYHHMANISIEREDLYAKLKLPIEALSQKLEVGVFNTFPEFKPYGMPSV